MALWNNSHYLNISVIVCKKLKKHLTFDIPNIYLKIFSTGEKIRLKLSFRKVFIIKILLR